MARWNVTLFAVVLLGVWAVPARADWDVGDPSKMHYPQLPTMSAQDMSKILADDWLCTGSGPVEDIHFWTFKEAFSLDLIPIYVIICSNDPNYNGLGYSAPYAMVWDRYFQPADYTVRDWGTSHWQFNITDIDDPFIQTEGQTYWLGLRIQTEPEPRLLDATPMASTRTTPSTGSRTT